MNNNWTKKEAPFLGLTGMGGGVASLMWAGAAEVGNTIWLAGRNTGGQLGQNQAPAQSAGRSSPTQLGDVTDWISFRNVNYNYNMGIRGVNGSADDTNGTLWTFGDQGSWGELGQNNLTAYSSPTQVGTDSTWAKLSAGSNSAATKSDGTLWMWGHNANGSLGDNSNIPRSSPMQIGTDTTWDADKLSVTSATTLTIKTDGTLWGWGKNQYGKFKLSWSWSDYRYSSPVQVGTDTNWKQVTGGQNMQAAIKTNGTLWTWGANGNGSLGHNATTGSARSSPTQIPGTNWAKVQMLSTAYAYGVAATKTDGTMWVWGRNVMGSLGLNEGGYAPYYSSPTQLGTDNTWHPTNWRGGYQAEGAVQAMKTDGTMWAWGENSYGSLGQNDTISRSSPVQITGAWAWWDGGYEAATFVGSKAKE